MPNHEHKKYKKSIVPCSGESANVCKFSLFSTLFISYVDVT